jgi:hypothetical protein
VQLSLDADADARALYAGSACRIHTAPDDPLRADYFVCANAAAPRRGVDADLLRTGVGQPVPTNVELRAPATVLCPDARHV